VAWGGLLEVLVRYPRTDEQDRSRLRTTHVPRTPSSAGWWHPPAGATAVLGGGRDGKAGSPSRSRLPGPFVPAWCPRARWLLKNS